MILIGTLQIPALKAALCAAFCARLRRVHLWSRPITRRGLFWRSAAALLPSTDGRIICSDSGCAWGFCSASIYLSDGGCTRGPAVSRSRIAPYRSLTRLSLDVIRVARRTSAEMPIGAGTLSRWVRAAASHPPGFDLAPSGEFEGRFPRSAGEMSRSDKGGRAACGSAPQSTARPARNFL